MKRYHGIEPAFDDGNLVASVGVVPLIELAEQAGLSALIDAHLTLPQSNVAAKARTVIAGMAAGADSIDDLDILRSGGTWALVEGVRAPSTIGSFLRSVTNGGHIEQFGKVNRMLLGELARGIPRLVDQRNDLVFIDIDDTIKEVHGHKKQGAGFGYTKVRGLNAMITTASTTTSHPVITDASLRRGPTRSGHGAARQISRAITTVRRLSPEDRHIWVRGDSAFCTHENVAAAMRAGAWFSFTIQHWPNVTAAIAAIPEDAWTPIKYPKAVIDEETGQWISEAEVAEIPFTAFVSRKAHEQVDCRLVVRRVVRKNKDAAAGQGELFTDYRHHAFITNAPFNTVDADAKHRGHAIVEQVIAELKDGPIAHLPSGNFHANALWLMLAIITFNVMRAAAHAAHLPNARIESVRRKIVNIPGRIAHTARTIRLHLPRFWPWALGWEDIWDSVAGWT